MAVERYKFLEIKKLDSVRMNANKILHGYSRHMTLLDELDEKLVSSFTDLRHWIERAPDQKR